MSDEWDEFRVRGARIMAEREQLARLHEVATERLAAVRVIADEWQAGRFSDRNFGAHQAMYRMTRPRRFAGGGRS